MALYIFSDAHLGATDSTNEEQRLQKISELFELIKEDGDRLIILGDLFDFWFEYENAIPNEYMKMLTMLAELRKGNVKIDYVAGNHDFWMGDFFPTQMGIEIYRDEFELTYQGRRIHLLHGDGLAKRDVGYRILKKVFRNRLNIWLYRKIPPDWGIPLAKYVSGASRKHTSPSEKLQRVEKKFSVDYENYAREKLKKGFDVVVLGHLHFPSLEKFESGYYINSGDFIRNFSYVKIDEESVKLLNLKN